MRRPLARQIAALSMAVSATAWPATAETPTPIAELVRDTPATVAGTVVRLTDDDEFLLSDSTGSVRIYVGPNRLPVVPGEAVTVIGFVDEDPALEIYAHEIVGADGTRHTFSHRY
jgi:uncharacterized protein YdeI (BOF family)